MIRLLFILLLLTAFPAMALDLKPLPDVEKMEITTFVEQSREIVQTYDEYPSLNFKVQLPKDFSVAGQETLISSQKNGATFGEVYKAVGPAAKETRTYFEIINHELSRAIAPGDWMRVQALKNNYTLRGLESDDEKGTFESFYVRLTPLGETEIVRARGFIFGQEMRVVEYVVPMPLWEENRDVQIFAIKSFEWVEKKETVIPEKLSEFSFLSSFAFSYPQSWTLTRNQAQSMARIDLSLKTANEHNQVFAAMDVALISTRSLSDRSNLTLYDVDLPTEIMARKQVILDRGYQVDPVLERHKFKPAFETDLAITEVYPLRRRQDENYLTDRKDPVTHELWITVIKEAGRREKNYVVSMIAPSREQDLYHWAVAAKAYEIMIESIR